MTKSPLERLLGRLDEDPETGCWIWTGCTSKRNGYGFIGVNGKNALTHRFAYEQLVGQISSGLELDHLCRRPACCNPQHLEPVTHHENVSRGLSPSALNAQKTACPKGHEYNEANTYVSCGRRHCRTCQREHARRRRAAKRATGA